jgi:hypothetical protein
MAQCKGPPFEGLSYQKHRKVGSRKPVGRQKKVKGLPKGTENAPKRAVPL